MLLWLLMRLSDVFVELGDSALDTLLKSVSIGKLKTFLLYERLKTRLHLSKLNAETLRKAEPALMVRLRDHDQELATDLSQAILISHFDLITAVLNFLEIPHDDGFFRKDMDPAPFLTEGWQTRVYEEFKGKYPDALLLFYINHLVVELSKEDRVYRPAA
jgi:hypothetical protein